MTTRENLIAVFDGETPERTPFYTYHWFGHDFLRAGRPDLFEKGMGWKEHCYCVNYKEHGVETEIEEVTKGRDVYKITRKKTPVGSIQKVQRNGWHHEDWIKEPEDYDVRRWIVENTELVPNWDKYYECEERMGDTGVTVMLSDETNARSPLMSINIDYAGTEQFCMDMGEELEELLALYEAQMKQFEEEMKLFAQGPGKYVKLFENLSIDMLGPNRYRDYLVPAYKKAMEILEPAGKRLMVHYDGQLQIIKDQIAAAPFNMVESLTEPPEGNMMYDECREAWQDKTLLCHINLDLYNRSDEVMREAVRGKRERLGKKATAFSISEALPPNWETKVEIILDELEKIG